MLDINLTTHDDVNFRDFAQTKTVVTWWIWNDILNLIISNPHINKAPSPPQISSIGKFFLAFHTLFKSFKLKIQIQILLYKYLNPNEPKSIVS